MKFILNKDTLEVDEVVVGNSGSVNYYEAEVEYDESWNNLNIEAVLVKKDDDVGTSIAVINNKFFIDKKLSGTYYIGFVGYTIENDKKTYQISSNLKGIYFDKGAGEIETEAEKLPTPTEWEIYIAEINKIFNDIKTLTNGLNEKVEEVETKLENGEFNGKDGYTPVKGIDYYTDKEKEDTKNEIINEITPTLNSNLKQAKDYTDNAIIKDFKDISYNQDTCTFVFTRHDNTIFTVDLPIENTVKDGRYDADTAELVLILVSDQEIRIPVSGLIDDYTGVDSATIQIVISADNKITCNIKSGSISKTLLTTELQEELNDKIGTEAFNQELDKKLNTSDVQEKTYEITYEDGTVETVRSVVFK